MCSPLALKITSRMESFKTHSCTNTPTHCLSKSYEINTLRIYFEVYHCVREVKVCV